MKISIKQEGGRFVADMPNFPTVGRGKTAMEALGSLLYCLQDQLKISVDVSDLDVSMEWNESQYEGKD